MARPGARLDGRVRSHREGDHNVNLVTLFFLGDAPAAAAFDSNRTTDREPHRRIKISDKVATGDQLIQIL